MISMAKLSSCTPRAVLGVWIVVAVAVLYEMHADVFDRFYTSPREEGR